MSVARCQRDVDSYEFAEWQEDMKTWEREANERAAMVCREIVNNRPFRATFAQLATIDDFMPKLVDVVMTEAGNKVPVQDTVLMKAEWARAMARWPKPKEPKV